MQYVSFYTTSLLILEQHSNQPIRFEGQVYNINCRFITIQSFPSGFREKLWVGLGLGIEIGLGLNIWNFVPKFVDLGGEHTVFRM